MRTPRKFNRRSFLKLLSTVFVAGISMAVAEHQRNEADSPKIEWVRVPIRGLPSALEGLRIVQLSDIHLYPFTSIELIRTAIVAINAMQPDIVALTGDYVSSLDAIDDLTPLLAGLNPRYGIYASLGNHDYEFNVEQVMRSFAKNRLALLVNKTIPITHNGATIYLSGIDDGMFGHPDWTATMAGVPGNGQVLLLSHEPDMVNIFANDPRVRLQLSGHTHGGQVRLFGMGRMFIPPLGEQYDMGLYHVKDAWVYTNRGLGTIVAPLRINCPPEITEITLVRA